MTSDNSQRDGDGHSSAASKVNTKIENITLHILVEQNWHHRQLIVSSTIKKGELLTVLVLLRN